MAKAPAFHRLSVIVPTNPFAPANLQGNKHCLCAMNVEKLMDWWPGKPHSPHRNATKVKAIQRSLDWKRVCQIAAYLLQNEIVDAPDRIHKYFKDIYQGKNEPGREWPPKITKVIGFTRSEFPTFSNVLIHVNGAKIENGTLPQGAANLVFDEDDPSLNFSVIDGQHRINGAYFAICILKETKPDALWEIPAEVFLDLDPPNSPPTKQAQVFIDVNFYQKKVDRSLVADLFPTARGKRDALDIKERAQDLGRKLMLETGPLVGMIQIPGIRYGVKDVITLATLNGAIEDVLEILEASEVTSLEEQTDFLAQVLEAWLESSGRLESKKEGVELDPENVVYQGRILVSVLTLVPVVIWKLEKDGTEPISEKALKAMTKWFKEVALRAGFIKAGKFMTKTDFKKKGYLGSGGIGRFRDALWAASLSKKKLGRASQQTISNLAETNRQKIWSEVK